ncbi:MAG: metalloregulator ArsR/SmtB family transcription factor [Polyangiaceae bacterium]
MATAKSTRARSSPASSAAARTATATRADASTDPTCRPGEHAHRRHAARPTLDDDAFERAASLFRAAGDVARLRLLDRLAVGEWCVTELADAAGVGLSTVSQQLRLLRAERIVARRRAGKHIYYRLADAHMRALIDSVLAHAIEHDENASDG